MISLINLIGLVRVTEKKIFTKKHFEKIVE